MSNTTEHESELSKAVAAQVRKTLAKWFAIIVPVLGFASYLGVPILLKAFATDTAVSVAVKELSKATTWDKIEEQMQHKINLLDEYTKRVEHMIKNYNEVHKDICDISSNGVIVCNDSNKTTYDVAELGLDKMQIALLASMRSIAASSQKTLNIWKVNINIGKLDIKQVELRILLTIGFSSNGRYCEDYTNVQAIGSAGDFLVESVSDEPLSTLVISYLFTNTVK